MADFKLHCFALSGNSYKAALFLNVSGLDWSPIFVDYLGGETKKDDWRLRLNPQGEVPVLEHDGKMISQSGVILNYLARISGQFGWNSEIEERDIWRWILFDNHKFTSYYATLRFMVGLQHCEESAATTFLRDRATAAYRIVDDHLTDRKFLVGERLTIADFSLAGYVFMPEKTGIVT